MSLFQQGFRITVGAAASLVETIQDQKKREMALQELQTQFSKNSQEWARKGEMTEQEARIFIEKFLNQKPASEATVTTSATEIPSDRPGEDSIEGEIKQLTQQITALRSELETLRSQEGDNN